MDILGFDRTDRSKIWKNKSWNNAATDDLKSIDIQISKITADLATIKKDYQEAQSKISLCEAEKEGLFNVYNCSKNTGKTLNQWYDILNTAQPQISSLESELKTLNAQRASAVNRIKQEAMAAGASAEAAGKIAESRSVESKASAEKAKSIGLWVAVGLGAVAIGALIFMKIIKKKK